MKKEHTGELFIFTEAIIWSLFPIITIISYKLLPSMVSLTIGTFFASLLFLFFVIYKKKLFELKNLQLWKYALGITLFISVLYYVFYFWGLTKTTSGNASIIALFEVCTSYVFFNIVKKEKFSIESTAGSILMVSGAFVVLVPNFTSLNFGDFFILVATFCAPMGNYLQQKATKISSTETILFLRSILAVPFLLLMTFVFKQHINLHEIKESLWVLLFSGIFIFGLSRVLWVEGIARISVTKANALNSIGPLFTLFFAFIIFHQVPTIWQSCSLIFFFFGVLLLTDNLKIKLRRA